jgi:sulfotransferase
MHIITGLPRSGSTLLCNIFNQNKSLHASHTSHLCPLIRTIITNLSSSAEFIGDLGRDRVGTEERVKRSLRAFCFSYYFENSNRIVFDKSRGWSLNHQAYKLLFPNGKTIVVLRDIRSIFGSIEKQNKKTALFDNSGDDMRTMDSRAAAMFADTGFIGKALKGVKDLVDRKAPVYYLRHEDLVRSPVLVMESLYNYLGIENFLHDFDNIENTATEADNMYLYKFPHEGCGKLYAPDIFEFREYFSGSFEESILNRHNWYYETFYNDGVLDERTI